MTNGDDRAYPVSTPPMLGAFSGLSKREWFAGLALSGLLANANLDHHAAQGGVDGRELYRAAALRYADALIEGLNDPAPKQTTQEET